MRLFFSALLTTALVTGVPTAGAFDTDCANFRHCFGVVVQAMDARGGPSVENLLDIAEQSGPGNTPLEHALGNISHTLGYQAQNVDRLRTIILTTSSDFTRHIALVALTARDEPERFVGLGDNDKVRAWVATKLPELRNGARFHTVHRFVKDTSTPDAWVGTLSDMVKSRPDTEVQSFVHDVLPSHPDGASDHYSTDFQNRFAGALVSSSTPHTYWQAVRLVGTRRLTEYRPALEAMRDSHPYERMRAEADYALMMFDNPGLDPAAADAFTEAALIETHDRAQARGTDRCPIRATNFREAAVGLIPDAIKTATDEARITLNGTSYEGRMPAKMFVSAAAEFAGGRLVATENLPQFAPLQWYPADGSEPKNLPGVSVKAITADPHSSPGRAVILSYNARISPNNARISPKANVGLVTVTGTDAVYRHYTTLPAIPIVSAANKEGSLTVFFPGAWHQRVNRATGEVKPGPPPTAYNPPLRIQADGRITRECPEEP